MQEETAEPPIADGVGEAQVERQRHGKAGGGEHGDRGLVEDHRHLGHAHPPADVLRGTLVRLENLKMATRLHTHDEILLEVPKALADAAADELRTVMRAGFTWSDGLPIMSEETIAPYYTKAGD